MPFSRTTGSSKPKRYGTEPAMYSSMTLCIRSPARVATPHRNRSRTKNKRQAAVSERRDRVRTHGFAQPHLNSIANKAAELRTEAAVLSKCWPVASR